MQRRLLWYSCTVISSRLLTNKSLLSSLQWRTYSYLLHFKVCLDNGCFILWEKIFITIPAPQTSFISYHVRIVEPNSPLLIGLSGLQKFKLVGDNLENELKSKIFVRKRPIIRKVRWLILVWNFVSASSTDAELNKVHQQWFYTSKNILFQLVRQAHPLHANNDCRNSSEDISNGC